MQPLFATLAWQKRPVFMMDIKEVYSECVCCPRTSDQTSCHHLVRPSHLGHLVRVHGFAMFLLVCRWDIWWLWLETVSWASKTSPVRSSRSFQMVRYLCAMMGVTILETSYPGPCVATGSPVGLDVRQGCRVILQTFSVQNTKSAGTLSHSVIL